MKNFIQKITLLVLTIACYTNINAKQVIGTQSFSWQDNNRKDIESGQPRTVEVQIWYPAEGSQLMGEVAVENAAPAKRFITECHGDYNDFYELPKLHPYPVVIISHNNKISKDECSYLCQAIARNKFVVMTITNDDDITDETLLNETYFADIEFMFNKVINSSFDSIDLARICNFNKIGVVTASVTRHLQNDRIKITYHLSCDNNFNTQDIIDYLDKNLLEHNEQAGSCIIF